MDSKRGDKVYRSMLNDSEPALKLPKTAAEGVDPDIVQDVSDFSQGMQDILEEPPFVPPPVPAEAPELLPEPLAAEAVPADAAGDVVQAPLLDWHDDPHWPRTIWGAKVHQETTFPSAGRPYCRYVVQCPYHRRCNKRRNAHASQTSNFGFQEPYGFLAAWLKLGPSFGTAREHIVAVPSLVAQREWLLETGRITE